MVKVTENSSVIRHWLKLAAFSFLFCAKNLQATVRDNNVILPYVPCIIHVCVPDKCV